MEVQLQVLVDPNLKGVVPEAISFETGLSRAQVADPNLYAYDHHGEEFSAIDPGALTAFYEDVILGRPMPLKFATRSLQGVDTIFAVTLFLHRDLVTHPMVPGMIGSIDLAHRRGPQGLAHIEESLARLLILLAGMFPPGLAKNIESQRIRTVVGWAYEFILNGQAPAGPPIPEVHVKTTGTNGFVIAESPSGNTSLGWVRLYQHGHLRGMIYGPEKGGRRSYLASRKSVFVSFNLVRAAALLNEVETSLGDPAHWKADELWLSSPPGGSRVPVEAVTEVLLRV